MKGLSMLTAEFLAASALHTEACLTVALFARLTGVDEETARWWVRHSPALEELRARHVRMRPLPEVDPVAHVFARCAPPQDLRRTCWEWAGSCTPQGVPQIKCGGYLGPVRRWLFEALNPGPQPKGMRIISRCINERCVSPHHMERMTPSQFGKWLHREHISSAAKRDGARRAARLRSATLSDEVVTEIRRLARELGLNGLQISQRIGCSHGSACNVLSGRTHNAHAGAVGAATVVDARKAKPVDVAVLAASSSVFRLGGGLGKKKRARKRRAAPCTSADHLALSHNLQTQVGTPPAANMMEVAS